jgi:hypothetical protein
MSKDNYTKVAGTYIDLISLFGVPFIRKIRNAVIAHNAEEMYSKVLQDQWLNSRLLICLENDKVYLSNMCKTEWNVMNDEIGLRKKLEVLYHERMNKKEEAKAETSDHNINIELIKKDEPKDADEEVINDIVVPEVNDEWEDDTHPDMAKFHNVL